MPTHFKTTCGARRRTNGEPCAKPAGHGTPHRGIGACSIHGGNMPNHLINAERKIARQTASIYGIPRHIDPSNGLIEEYWRTAGIVSGLEAKVTSLDEGEVVWGITDISEEDLGENRVDADGQPIKPAARVVKSRAGLNTWIKLFNEERDRFRALGTDIVRLGLEARRDEYIRAQVEVFAGVLLSPDLGLSEVQRQTAGRLLRALESKKIIEGEVTE